ncbi:hypothetical protein [Aquimarina longa]|uniref:hypothetical protein n=1 Tax=Aquimarina longa TaxID=1080221 RepID=UPI0011E033CE|nr:hypothetical protein [Aquimarina longa]
MINKKVISVLCILFLAHISSAQQNNEESNLITIFDSESSKITGFGGSNLNFSSVMNQFAFFAGGKGGIIINHKTVFGIEGYHLTTDITHKKIETNQNLNFIYGGFFGAYIVNWKSIVHLIPSVMIGWGGIGEKDNHSHNEHLDVSDSLFIIQPSLELEFNIYKAFRVGLGVNYRTVSGLNTDFYSNNDFSSLGGILSLKFGKF